MNCEYRAMITDREFTCSWTEALRPLRSYARWLCGDPLAVDDLIQQTALQAWEARHQLRPDSNFRGWLYAILRNYHYSGLRRKSYEVADPEGTLSDSIAVEPNYQAERDLAEVSVALEALPKDQRQALSHVTLHGLSYAETARLCSCKEGTIKSRVARARQRLFEAVTQGISVSPRSERVNGNRR
jgi:RNA polymerase sigma-70 factor (ECF subfamily)